MKECVSKAGRKEEEKEKGGVDKGGGDLPVSAVIPLSFSCHVCWKENTKQNKDSVRMSYHPLPPVVTGQLSYKEHHLNLRPPRRQVCKKQSAMRKMMEPSSP